MNISYNWLKDLINIDFSPSESAAALTRVGLAVEGVHAFGDDQIFDIDLTSNRPDCLSHLGVAREIRAITGNALIGAATAAEDEEIPFPAALADGLVRVEDSALCYRFTARLIKNVKVGPSPEWLVERLEAVGERSINNVADITNYVMLELGQPMHAFDLDKLTEKRIVVRRARSGERIRTLDDFERELDTDVLVIADAEKPAAIGGVMGGLESSITDETANVLLEVAYFDRSSIRGSSRRLNLATEASYRFERGVDIENLKRASDRAAQLIAELAGGEIGDFVDVYPHTMERSTVSSADISGAVKRLTGLDVDEEKCLQILDALGISETEKSEPGVREFVSPTWRHDISIEEDLVEEIARHTGYELIPEELSAAAAAGEYQPGEMRKLRLRTMLADLSFDEAISYSFISTEFDDVYEAIPELINENAAEPYVTLKDSVIEGAVRMRSTLLPGLLAAVRTNLNFQRRDVSLFEIGKVFAASSKASGLPYEREVLAIVMTGSAELEQRALTERQIDFFDAKGAVEAALDAAGIDVPVFEAFDVKHLRAGQSASVSVDGRSVGYVGRLDDNVAAQYKFKQPVYLAEIDLQTLLSINMMPAVYRPLPKYPSAVRDVSLIAKRDISFDAIKNTVIDMGMPICQSVGFVDVYEGKGIDAGSRSITIRLEYRSPERTLVDDEVDEVHTKIIAVLQSSLGIQPRM